ncbi:hypothetical protein GCM10007380_09740 [Gottfriedia solisilvae]|uniref:Uncharacterized protein n=1 Tax=Gottfriedia solisilvae TaxID=1516104 RepID=A0A8J3ADN7_9BACI|nr:hypothetical protein GCM10007380_09740 [Gottfriedia solisilvae]
MAALVIPIRNLLILKKSDIGQLAAYFKIKSGKNIINIDVTLILDTIYITVNSITIIEMYLNK